MSFLVNIDSVSIRICVFLCVDKKCTASNLHVFIGSSTRQHPAPHTFLNSLLVFFLCIAG
jgi:hypothetical protein